MSDTMLLRLAALTEVARRKSEKGRVGKTALQKLLYLLQELGGADLGYHFDLYTYGPYDATVMRDIDYCESLDVLKIEYEEERGYSISISDNAHILNTYITEFANKYRDKVDFVFDKFGAMSAKDLELWATTIYVNRENPKMTTAALVQLVHEIKPKFDQAQIEQVVAKVRGAFLGTVASKRRDSTSRRREAAATTPRSRGRVTA